MLTSIGDNLKYVVAGNHTIFRLLNLYGNINKRFINKKYAVNSHYLFFYCLLFIT